MANDPNSPSADAGLSAPRTGNHTSGLCRPLPQESTRAALLARVADLEGRLATLPALEQAKGALMATYGISADAAFALLRFHSQNRNVKVRAIAAQLTTLMCAGPGSAEAIIRFDRLLDEVTRSLQPPPAPAGNGPAAGEGPASRRQLDAGNLDQVTLRAAAAAPPGIIIAGNAPGLPLVCANDAFTEITGYPTTKILGRNCRFLQGGGVDGRSLVGDGVGVNASEAGDRRGFDAEADLDLVHQDLDPAAEGFDHLCGGPG